MGENKDTVHGICIRDCCKGSLCIHNSVDRCTSNQDQPSSTELCVPLVDFCTRGAVVHGGKDKVAVLGDESKTSCPVGLEIAFLKVKAGFKRTTIRICQHVNHLHISRADEVVADNLGCKVFPAEFWW